MRTESAFAGISRGGSAKSDAYGVMRYEVIGAPLSSADATHVTVMDGPVCGLARECRGALGVPTVTLIGDDAMPAPSLLLAMIVTLYDAALMRPGTVAARALLVA